MPSKIKNLRNNLQRLERRAANPRHIWSFMILDFYSDLQIVCNLNRCAWCSYDVCFFKSLHSIVYFSEKIEITVSALLYRDRNRRYIVRRIWLKLASLYRHGIPYCQKMRGRCCRLQSEAHIILRLARFLGKARMFHYILYFPRWKWFESCLWKRQLLLILLLLPESSPQYP